MWSKNKAKRKQVKYPKCQNGCQWKLLINKKKNLTISSDKDGQTTPKIPKRRNKSKTAKKLADCPEFEGNANNSRSREICDDERGQQNNDGGTVEGISKSLPVKSLIKKGYALRKKTLMRIDNVVTNSDDGEEEVDNDGVNFRVRKGEDNFGDSVGSSDSEVDDQSEEEEGEITPPSTPRRKTSKKRTVKRLIQPVQAPSTFTQAEFLKWKDDPNFKQFVSLMVEEKLQQEKVNDEAERRGKICDKQTGKRNINATVVKDDSNPIKSPSDSTLYTPALKKGKQADNLINKISAFVENIRLETKEASGSSGYRTPERPSCSKQQQQQRTPQAELDKFDELEEEDDDIPDMDVIQEEPAKVAKRITDKVILEAEQRKAILTAPKGMIVDKTIQLLRNLDNDDDFFHSSCHIDDALKDKIERGQFVELDKLLPREKLSSGLISSDFEDAPPIQLIKKGGNTYLGSAVRETKITSLKKWDQAFRVYSTIYCQANPSRSAEILQYVDIVHNIASSYPWDSVMYYDVIFRQLMASKPWRSWAKTYTQGWNLALKSRINESNFSAGGYVQKTNGGGFSSKDNWKEKCCWRYNKNKCSKSSSDCSWDHRCKFCAGWNHGYHNCRKRLGGNGYSNGGGQRRGANTSGSSIASGSGSGSGETSGSGSGSGSNK